MSEEKKRPLIIDAFTFFEETDMLEFRMRVLWDVVDKFVIVEGDHGFSGQPKNYNFEEVKEKFEWAKQKIVYHKFKADIKNLKLNRQPVEYDPSHDCWKIEYQQRNAIADAIKPFAADSIILLGDVDEIPSHEAIELAKEQVSSLPLACRQAFFYYSLSNLRSEIWNGTIITTAAMIRKKGAQALRDARNSLMVIERGGWHLSYFGGAGAIKRKIQNFSHQEYNVEKFKDTDHIEFCIQSGHDLFKRPVGHYKVGRGFFPRYFLEHIENAEWWGK